MNELTIGVVGCSGVGRSHVTAWSLQSGARITAVCDADTLVAARTVMAIEGAAAFSDGRSLLNAEKYDIVDVCLPLEERAEAVESAIRAGANVICDTPIATTGPEARSLVKLAADKERLLMPAYIHRFHPPILFARELLENDDLGRAISFRCRFTDPRGFLIPGKDRGPDLAGVTRETGQHGIDLFRALLGEVTEAVGLVAAITPGLAVDDASAIVLRSERGALGVVETSQSVTGSRNVVEIYCTVGSCLIDYDSGTIRYLSPDYPSWQSHDVSGLNGLEGCLAHFADVVRGLQPLAVSGVDSARAIEIIEGLGSVA